MDKFDLSIISDLILSKGLKATTMDDVANALTISKRTLYERYPSKNKLIKEVIDYWQKIHRAKIETIMRESNEMMEAYYHAFTFHHTSMLSVNPRFYQDLEIFYPDARGEFDKHKIERDSKFLRCIHKGIEQGVFRESMNYLIVLKLLDLQYEAIKRMEVSMGLDINLPETFRGLKICFLRSIATSKGMEILDKLCDI